jgi:hypothetical protein
VIEIGRLAGVAMRDGRAARAAKAERPLPRSRRSRDGAGIASLTGRRGVPWLRVLKDQHFAAGEGMRMSNADLIARLELVKRSLPNIVGDTGEGALRNEEGGRPPKDENRAIGTVSHGSNSAAYLVAKLERDRPDIVIGNRDPRSAEGSCGAVLGPGERGPQLCLLRHGPARASRCRPRRRRPIGARAQLVGS